MSRFVTVRDYVQNLLEPLRANGFEFSTIPAGRAFLDRPTSGKGGTWHLEESDSRNESAYAGTYTRERELLGYVLVYGLSDGRSIGDADADAWEGAELAAEAIDGQQVSGLPAGTVIDVLQTGKMEPFAIDQNTFGVAVPVTTVMKWETTP